MSPRVARSVMAVCFAYSGGWLVGELLRSQQTLEDEAKADRKALRRARSEHLAALDDVCEQLVGAGIFKAVDDDGLRRYVAAAPRGGLAGR